MSRKRKREETEEMRNNIEQLFSNGIEEFDEINRKDNKIKKTEQRKPFVGLKPKQPSLFLTLSKLNGSYLKSNDIASLVHYSAFGNAVKKPIWSVTKLTKNILQTVVIRVNCEKDIIESNSLSFIDNFFERSWIQTEKDVNCRETFWKSLLNVEMSVREMVAEKCSTSKQQNSTSNDETNVLDIVMCIEDLASNGYPFPGEENIIPTKIGYNPISSKSPLFAIDCEMCLTSAYCHELTRISIVDFDGNIVLDTFVKPANEITNYLTQFSGVTEDILENVTTTLSDVQKAIQTILPPDAILVGHSLEFDLRALKLAHPYCIDTAHILNFSNNGATKNSLKNLTKLFLNEDIQKEFGHCSYEDAWAAMKLVKLKIQKGLVFGNIKLGWDYKNFQIKNDSNSQKSEKKKRKEFEELKKFENSCKFCKNPTVTNCTVANCSCHEISGPLKCVKCQINEKSNEGEIDWRDALFVEMLQKTKPIEEYLNIKNKTTIMCAIGTENLEEEKSRQNEKKRWKSPENFKNLDEFVNELTNEIMKDQIVLVELNYPQKIIEKEKDEKMNQSAEINDHLEKLIKSVCYNGLIMVVLASDSKSILYCRIKQG